MLLIINASIYAGIFYLWINIFFQASFSRLMQSLISSIGILLNPRNILLLGHEYFSCQNSIESYTLTPCSSAFSIRVSLSISSGNSIKKYCPLTFGVIASGSENELNPSCQYSQ